MIESITIKNVATFDSSGIQINDLKKVNYIYGANASGKTTISNFLYSPDDETFINSGCFVKWKNDQKLKSLVYNKSFREKSIGNGKLPGVFTLGEATIDHIKKIDEKTHELQLIKEVGIDKREKIKEQEEKKENLEENFKENCWKRVYQKYKDVFKEAFKGSLYKESFKNRLLQNYPNNAISVIPYNELLEKAKIIFDKAPEEMATINAISFDRIIEIESNPIWNKRIIGKADVDIAQLINKLNITDWVHQGRDYVMDNDICPFCQQPTIDETFRKQLESFFDETYLNDIKLLKKLSVEYDILLQNITNELNAIETNKNSKLDVDKFSIYLKTLTSICTTNKEYLIIKEKEPSRNIELISLKVQLELIAKLIDNANNEIQKHNRIVSNYKIEKSNLIKSIWEFVVDEYKSEIANFKKDKSRIETDIENLKKQREELLKTYNTLKLEIEVLNKNVTSIQPTIDKMNRLLKSFGFSNFEIVPSTEREFYQIQRENGELVAQTLSEGEITFITFLYFLHLAKGGTTENTVNDERILVIDDPVSCLDSNVLFFVCSLIKQLGNEIKENKGNIKQLILLTHNIHLHIEVSDVGENREKEQSHFWILRKNNEKSTIQFYGDKNPVQSSYELLWHELREWNKYSGASILNTMRRILKNFFSAFATFKSDLLFDNHDEQKICQSLLHWVDERSHTLNDETLNEIPIDEIIEKYLYVFEEIFVRTEHERHYDVMMRIK